MRLLVVIAAVALIGLVSAAPQEDDVKVTKQESEIKDDGSFKSVLELSDGTVVSQSGSIKNPEEQDPEKQILAVTGEYKFTDKKTGETVGVKYTADENGYQPVVSRK